MDVDISSADKLFERAFKRGMKIIRERDKSFFHFSDLPLLEGEVHLADYCVVRGAELTALRNVMFEVVGPTMEERRQYDEQGNVKLVKRNWSCPKDCLIVKTTQKLEGILLDKKEFSYVDYRDIEDAQEFYYYIHKRYLYKVNMCALVVSENRRSDGSHYGGRRLMLRNGRYVYLYILPFKSRKHTKGYRIVAVGASLYFSDEIRDLLDMWQELGLIYRDERVFDIKNGMGEDYNLIEEYYDSDLEYVQLEDESVLEKEKREQSLREQERVYV